MFTIIIIITLKLFEILNSNRIKTRLYTDQREIGDAVCDTGRLRQALSL